MSHAQQQFFIAGIKQFLPGFFQGNRVLEVGSLNINGSVRQHFDSCEYIGLDVGPGRDVDIVCPGEDYGERSGSFDFVISCEAMEHNPNWRKTWLNMLRLVKGDGLIVMTCAGLGRKQHGTEQFNPFDSPLTVSQSPSYYRNLCETDFTNLVSPGWCFSEWAFLNDHSAHDLYFYGLAADASQDDRNRARELRAAFHDHYYKVNVLGVQ